TYLLYQTLVGTWPFDPDGWRDPGYAERVVAYLHKALQEAKVHSSWIDPETEYHDAVGRFVHAVLDPARAGEFLADFRPFADRVARLGVVNALAQTLVKCTAPGIPD